jgi:hypothetical protein
MSSPRLRRFVKHALMAASGEHPNAAQLGSAFDLLSEQLRARLRPLFGGDAISALFARAVHLARAEFPWLSDVIRIDGHGCSNEAMKAVSTTLPPDAIAEGLAAVLAHDIGLLITFIGDDFVMPLVQEAWGGVSEWAARSEDDHE